MSGQKCVDENRPRPLGEQKLPLSKGFYTQKCTKTILARRRSSVGSSSVDDIAHRRCSTLLKDGTRDDLRSK